MSREKPSLPYGWIVKQSSSYPDRVYYFNTHSGVTTWEMPHLVKASHGTKPAAHQAGRKQFSPPCSPHYSPTDSSDDSPYYGEEDKLDPQNEPVFSQFQKNIYDHVISNSPSHNKDELVKPVKEECSPGHVPKLSPGKCSGNTSKHKDREKVSVKDFKSKPEEKVPRVKFKVETPDSNLVLKKEAKDKSRKFAQTDRQHSFNISRVLSEIRKDVESSDNVKTSKKKVSSKSDSVYNNQKTEKYPSPERREASKGEVISSPQHFKTQNKSLLPQRRDAGKREVVCSPRQKKTEDKSLLPLRRDVGKREVICSSQPLKTEVKSPLPQKRHAGKREVVCALQPKKTKNESPTAAKAGQSSELKQNIVSDSVHGSSSKGLWTRKRRMSDSSTSDVVPEKIVAKNKLSFKISVGEKRKVILSPERRKSTKSSQQSPGDSFDLNVEDETVEESLHLDNQNSSSVGVQSSVFERLNDSSKVSPLSIAGGGPAVKTFKPNHQPDIRRVVSSDSEANTNNSAPGDTPGACPPSQADRLDRVQEWVDLINGSQEVQPETPVWSQAPDSVQAAQGHPHDEAEICDMEVDEDTDEEEMVIDLHEVRGELEFSSSQSTFSLSPPCSATQSEAASQGLCLVVDTSVMINHLKLLSDLHDEELQGFGLPTLVFPWVVLQELDALKDNRARLTLSMSCQNKARRAVKYINACFTGKHPRVTGQSHVEDIKRTYSMFQAAEMVENLEIECNDDRVLQCCLQFRNKFPTSYVILLSEDVNLCNKAMMCGLDAGSIKNIREILVLSNAVQDQKSTQESNIAPERAVMSQSCAPLGSQRPCPHPPSLPPEKHHHTSVTPCHKVNRVQIDEMVVTVKAVVKDTLGLVLETEMKAAYDDIWKSVVYRKPPWTAADIMESMNKHWMAVFGMILPKHISKTVSSITNKFQPYKVPLLRSWEVLELIKELMQLMEALQKHSNYEGRVSISIDKLKAVQMQLHHLRTTSTPSAPSSSTPSRSTPSLSTATQIQTFTNKPVASQSSKPTQVSVDHPDPSTCTGVTPHSQCPSQPDTFLSSSDLDAKPPTSSLTASRLKARPKAANSNNAVNTATNSTAAAEQAVVHNCFQLVWANVYQVCVEIEASLLQSVSNDYLSLLTRLTRIIKDLRYEFALCLSISPYEISNEREKFQNFCDQLNTVFVKLKHKPVEFESVTVNALMSFFRNTSNRPILQSGLMQLDDIIRSLYELVKKLPD